MYIIVGCVDGQLFQVKVSYTHLEEETLLAEHLDVIKSLDIHSRVIIENNNGNQYFIIRIM